MSKSQSFNGFGLNRFLHGAIFLNLESQLNFKKWNICKVLLRGTMRSSDRMPSMKSVSSLETNFEIVDSFVKGRGAERIFLICC